jgi:hypothetical protein
MGTREPESATGKTGTGMIPRTDRYLRRLVGAFNGGFQALHGEYGMMADGRVYIPPKPWAATVAVFDDGRVGMGSWPGPDRRRKWDEAAATRQIPDDMIAMRQNLTSVVEDGVYNPWKRWYWGAAPEAAEEQTYIHRSGVCLTEEGFMAFLWGESMGPEEVGRAMLKMRCLRGLHLDMNSKHTGFEFYRSYPPGQRPPPLDRELTDAEFEGEIPGARGYLFRARKAVTAMKPIRFPRYLFRDPRDFFYLTLKPTLPGPDLRDGNKSIKFSAEGLPHAGWPPAFAKASLERGPVEVTLVRIDPRRAVPRGIAEPAHRRALAHLSNVSAGVSADGDAEPADGGPAPTDGDAAPGAEALFATHLRVGWGFSVGRPGKRDRVLLAGPPLSDVDDAGAAIGVDGDGFLVYVETTGEAPGALASALRAAAALPAIALPAGARLAFAVGDRFVSVDGNRELETEEGKSTVLLAEERPPASVIFPDTEPMPYRKWGWLQGKRVRYFPTGPPRFPVPDHAK